MAAKWGPLSLGDWVWPLAGVLHPGVAAEWALGDCMGVGVLLPGVAAEWGPLSLGDWVWPLTGVFHPGVAADRGPLSLDDWVCGCGH